MAGQPWTRRQVATVAVAQVVGTAVALVGFGVAVFSLPATGWFSDHQNLGTRLWGVLGAVVTAVALPAGLWATARSRGSRSAAATGAIIGAVILALAAFYGLTR